MARPPGLTLNPPQSIDLGGLGRNLGYHQPEQLGARDSRETEQTSAQSRSETLFDEDQRRLGDPRQHNHSSVQNYLDLIKEEDEDEEGSILHYYGRQGQGESPLLASPDRSDPSWDPLSKRETERHSEPQLHIQTQEHQKHKKKKLPWSSRGRAMFYPRQNLRAGRSSGQGYNVISEPPRRRNRVTVSKTIGFEFHNIRPVEGRYASAPSRSVRLLGNHDNKNLQLNITAGGSVVGSHKASRVRKVRTSPLDLDRKQVLLSPGKFVRKSLPSRGRPSGPS